MSLLIPCGEAAHTAGSCITYVRAVEVFSHFFSFFFIICWCGFRLAVHSFAYRWQCGINHFYLDVMAIIVQSPTISNRKKQGFKAAYNTSISVSPWPVGMINQTSNREICIQIPTSISPTTSIPPQKFFFPHLCLTGWWGWGSNETTWCKAFQPGQKLVGLNASNTLWRAATSQTERLRLQIVWLILETAAHSSFSPNS